MKRVPKQEHDTDTVCVYPAPNNPVERTAHSTGSVLIPCSVAVGRRSPGALGVLRFSVESGMDRRHSFRKGRSTDTARGGESCGGDQSSEE